MIKYQGQFGTEPHIDIQTFALKPLELDVNTNFFNILN